MALSSKYILFIGCFCFLNCFAQQEPEVIQIWEGIIPDARENSKFKEIEVIKDSVISSLEQVSIPTLTVFKPEKPNGTAVIICPGGGYHHLAINKEGYKVAEWFNTLGITAFVLKYRLPNNTIMKDKSIGPLQDVQKAMRYVRQHARIWNINKNKIGVIGFSAGGHLAATLSTQFDKQVCNVEDNISAKPNFAILIYPVISMQQTIAHKGSKNNLLGDNPSEEKQLEYSNEKQVTEHTPKTFLIHANDDKSVSVENSIQYYLALKAHNVPAEIHIYESGGHGFGLGINNRHQWLKSCENWLVLNKWIMRKTDY